MRLRVQTRSGRELVSGGLELDDQASVRDLQLALQQARPGSKFHPTRQRLTVPGSSGGKPMPLGHGKQLADYGLRDGAVVSYKDLGLQVGYSTVFVLEYLGPILVYALIYFCPGLAYSHLQHAHRSGLEKLVPYQEPFPPKKIVQKLAMAYWTFHYVKRILETIFLHKFSHATMPVFNLFKNCGYYWGYAAFIAYFINHPLYTPPPLAQTYAAFAFALLCQWANFRCHQIQASLRPAGGTGYAIPRGFLFDALRVTCANYTAEIWGWIAFTVAVQTVAPGLFILGGGMQMAIWGTAKHARLRKVAIWGTAKHACLREIFNGKDGKERYPRRWVLFPPLY